MKVSLKGVHKFVETEAGTQKILQNINLTINKGDFVAIMGASGAGKSTLLYLIGCLDFPSIGQIYLEEIDVVNQPESVREKIRLKNIGFIFQNFNLLPNLTAIENVELPLQILGLPHNKSLKRSESLLRLVGLDHKSNELPNSFSGGEQQRIAIGRALANMPGLLLADEPTGNLDLKSGKAIMEVVRSINENQHITTIIVTHDPKIASFADKTYYLEDGRLIQTAL